MFMSLREPLCQKQIETGPHACASASAPSVSLPSLALNTPGYSFKQLAAMSSRSPVPAEEIDDDVHHSQALHPNHSAALIFACSHHGDTILSG